jgi:hypothetical protein
MDFINELLAKLFDSFKANNPKLATAIIFGLGVLMYASENGLPELIGYDLSKIVQWIAFALAALQGSRTTKILHPELKDK